MYEIKAMPIRNYDNLSIEKRRANIVDYYSRNPNFPIPDFAEHLRDQIEANRSIQSMTSEAVAAVTDLAAESIKETAEIK